MVEPSSGSRDPLLRTLRALARRTSSPVTFGGLVSGHGAPLAAFVGTRGRSLADLVIEPAQGLGGLALSDRRPIATTEYRRSHRITHPYDRQVTAEGIVSLLAVPVVVDDRVHAIIYTGHREATQFGDAAVGEAVRAARDLAWEYSVSLEVDRRLAALESDGRVARPDESGADRRQLQEAFASLRELSRDISDPLLAGRVDAVARIVLPGTAPAGAPALSPRELDVLAELALGKRNAQIGRRLGLRETTVKSYVSSALRKLDVSSRYEAVVAARRAGLLP